MRCFIARPAFQQKQDAGTWSDCSGKSDDFPAGRGDKSGAKLLVAVVDRDTITLVRTRRIRVLGQGDHDLLGTEKTFPGEFFSEIAVEAPIPDAVFTLECAGQSAQIHLERQHQQIDRSPAEGVPDENRIAVLFPGKHFRGDGSQFQLEGRSKLDPLPVVENSDRFPPRFASGDLDAEDRFKRRKRPVIQRNIEVGALFNPPEQLCVYLPREPAGAAEPGDNVERRVRQRRILRVVEFHVESGEFGQQESVPRVGHEAVKILLLRHQHDGVTPEFGQ